jgi:hypothetical protein
VYCIDFSLNRDSNPALPLRRWSGCLHAALCWGFRLLAVKFGAQPIRPPLTRYLPHTRCTLITRGHHLSSAKQATHSIFSTCQMRLWLRIVFVQCDSPSQGFCGALSRSLLLMSLGARHQNTHRAILSHHWLSYLIRQVWLSLHLIHSFRWLLSLVIMPVRWGPSTALVP